MMTKKKNLVKLEDASLIDMWNEFIHHIAAMELEVFKNARGNVAAGVRFRNASIRARKMLIEMKRQTMENDKSRRKERRKKNEDQVI